MRAAPPGAAACLLCPTTTTTKDNTQCHQAPAHGTRHACVRAVVPLPEGPVEQDADQDERQPQAPGQKKAPAGWVEAGL